MARNEGIIRDGNGNLVCYLNEHKNGGIDLYDEYNKGVDKIVNAFQECVDKLQMEIDNAKAEKSEAMQQSDDDFYEENERFSKMFRELEEKEDEYIMMDQELERREQNRYEALEQELKDEVSELQEAMERECYADVMRYIDVMAEMRQINVDIGSEYEAMRVFLSTNLVEAFQSYINDGNRHLAVFIEMLSDYGYEYSTLEKVISSLEHVRESIRIGEVSAVSNKLFDKWNSEGILPKMPNWKKMLPQDFCMNYWLDLLLTARINIDIAEEKLSELKQNWIPYFEEKVNSLDEELKQFTNQDIIDKLIIWIEKYMPNIDREEFKRQMEPFVMYEFKCRPLQLMSQLCKRDSGYFWFFNDSELIQYVIDQEWERAKSLKNDLKWTYEYYSDEWEKELDAITASYNAQIQAAHDEYEEKKRAAEQDNNEQEQLALGKKKEALAERYRQWEIENDAMCEKYRERNERFEAEYDARIEELKAAAIEELNILLGQLEENGMADICGFDYREAWPNFHPFATNTLCMPANLEKSEKQIIEGLTAKAYSVDPEYCEFVPKHFAWGYSPVECDAIKLEGKIEKILMKNEKLNLINEWGDGDENYYHIKTPPFDTFYKIDCTPMEDGPAMIAYDLGNLDEDSTKRKSFMDFILRTFVFGMVRCAGGDDHLNFNIISMQHGEYFSGYRQDITSKNLNVYTERPGAQKAIARLRENRSALGLGLGNNETFFDKNRKRSKDERPPAENYEFLIVVNTDYKELEGGELRALLRSSREKQSGMYSWLLVDINKLERMDKSERTRSVEPIRNYVNDIETDDRFYIISEGYNEGEFQIEPSSKDEILYAVEGCQL